MPITGTGSYPATMEEFNLHWVAVNQFDTANQLVLPGNYAWSNFSADQNAILAAITAVTQAATSARIAAANLQIVKEPMRQRITQFRQTVQLSYANSPYAHSAPLVPDLGAIETKFLAPFDDVSQIWGQINMSSPDPSDALKLPGGYTLQQFNPDVNGLKAAFQNRDTADMQTKLRRDERDALLKPIYERMLQYRTAVVLHLPAGNPLLNSVPRLSPIPGSTPPGLEVHGEWDSATSQAHLTWVASTFHDLNKLQVRGCTGSTYKAADEEAVADLDKTATEYSTDWGLTSSGALAVFKVYVMATTGNENGGKAVKIVRPEM